MARTFLKFVWEINAALAAGLPVMAICTTPKGHEGVGRVTRVRNSGQSMQVMCGGRWYKVGWSSVYIEEQVNDESDQRRSG
jgi:hypothetical protein